MSWVDLLIIIVVVLAAFLGHAEGAVRQIIRFVGFGVGFAVGTLVAPSLSNDITHSSSRPALALGLIFVITILGGELGSVVGSLAAQALSAVSLGTIDRLAGVVVGAAGALVGCWLAAGLLASTTWGSVASGIQQSSILSTMDHVMPPVPTLDARVQALFRNINFPDVFSSVVSPSLGSYVNPRTLGPLVAPVGSPSSVVKVIASGTCSTDSEGTAFYVTSNELITNAHVVAGHSHVTVSGVAAQVALFDPKNDLAVLRVAVDATPLAFYDGAATRGTRVQVVGFPLDESRTAAPGYIDGELTGNGRDIYNTTNFAKTVLALEVNVNPGSSGSPVLVGSHVVGVIESKLVSQSSTAYAIPDSVIKRDLATASSTGTASTQSCLS